MSLEVVLPIVVTRNPRAERDIQSSSLNKVLLLSEYQEDEQNYPVINILPDYDPDLALGIRIQAKNLNCILHSSVKLQDKNFGIVYVNVKATNTKEDDFYFLFSSEQYEHFSQIAPKLLLPKARVTVLDSENGSRMLETSGISVPEECLDNSMLRFSSLEPLQSYVRFLTTSPTSLVSKADFREQMSRQESLLSLLASLGWTDKHVMSTLVIFISSQKCANPSCPKFCRLSCGGCRMVHYCGLSCQQKSFPQHKVQCPLLKLDKMKSLHCGVFVEEQVRRRLKVEDLPSFELFVQLISSAIFELFSETFDVPSIESLIIEILIKGGTQVEKHLIKNLKKFSAGRGKSLSDLEKEMVQNWGKSNRFSELLQDTRGSVGDVRNGKINADQRKSKSKKVHGSKIEGKKTGKER